MGLSPLGGGFAGVSETGVMGLGLNPAAAKSEHIEGAIDVGLSLYSLGVTLDGAEGVHTTGISPTPTVALTVPIQDFGLGAYFMVPYGGGADFPADGAQRFHVISTESFLMEGGLSVAYQPVDWVRGGASFRVGQATLSKHAAMNTASLLNSKTDLSPPLDVADPLFLGEQDVNLSGHGYGYGLGLFLSAQRSRGPHRLSVADACAHGREVSLKPSDALGLLSMGRPRGRCSLPASWSSAWSYLWARPDYR